MRTELILIRHGETETNVKGKIHRSFGEETLTDIGIKQINQTSIAIKKYSPDIIYCSREKRAVQSATIIAEKLGIPLVNVEGLEERNWGDYAGLSFPEIKEKAGIDNMSFEERYNFHPPNGESWKETEERLLKVLIHTLETNEGKNVVLVTHGGSIRILMPTLLMVDKTESYKYDPNNASISVFDFVDGIFTKIIYGDTSHLAV